MLLLTLVRHAKSDWGDPRLSDHDRPLNSRGERDAPEMAVRLAEAGVSIDRILSSTAVRARTTAAHFGAALGVPVEQHFELYLAAPDTLFSTAAAAGVDSVLLVAHDPGLSDLASQLSAGGIEHMPTCATASFAWSADAWADADGRAADAWSFDSPRGGSWASLG